MDSKQLVDAVLTGEETAANSFEDVMNQKLADALEVQKVELASNIMSEKVVNPYAVGMAAAKKKFGYGKKPAHDLPKKVVVKGHEIAKKVMAKEETEQVEEKYMGFAAVKKAVAAKGARNPAAVAAYIGRKKYGKEKFQAMAAAGKRAANEEVESVEEAASDWKKTFQKVARKNLNKDVGHLKAKVKRMQDVGKQPTVSHKVTAKPTGVDEEVNESSLTDAQKLTAMKDPKKAATLAALKRYQAVGDINKLSSGHRSLVAKYMERTGGLQGTARSVELAALKKVAAQEK